MDFLKHINQHRPYAYYAFPMLMAFLVTFVTIRSIISLYPHIALFIDGIHVHHFLPGILILGIAGYCAFWTKSSKKKYVLALVYGCGMAFVLDEFYFLLRLDASPINYQQYDAVVISAVLLLALILLPGGIHGLLKLFESGNDE